MITTPMVIN